MASALCSTSLPAVSHYRCPLRTVARSRPFLTPSKARQRLSTGIRCVLAVTEENWDTEVLKADRPVLVDFWAPWCGPCKLIAPVMDSLEQEYGDVLKVVKVEHDSNPQIIQRYNVYGLPALLLFKDGEQLADSKKEGAIPKAGVIKYLQKHGIIQA